MRGSISRRHSRDPVPWKPATALREDGRVTADPLAVLQDAGQFWGDEWQAESQPLEEEDAEWLRELHRAAEDETVELEPLTPELLRAGSGQFRRVTSQAAEGFHVRHWGFLSDLALAVLCTLLAVWESKASPLRNPLVLLILARFLAVTLGGRKPPPRLRVDSVAHRDHRVLGERG